jgi:isocitrate/isopropylmalate dehydrogenase
MILTTCMMLDWLSATRGDASCSGAASAIREAVNHTLESGVTTVDIGGSSTTAQVGEAVARSLGRGADVK